MRETAGGSVSRQRSAQQRERFHAARAFAFRAAAGDPRPARRAAGSRGRPRSACAAGRPQSAAPPKPALTRSSGRPPSASTARFCAKGGGGEVVPRTVVSSQPALPQTDNQKDFTTTLAVGAAVHTVGLMCRIRAQEEPVAAPC